MRDRGFRLGAENNLRAGTCGELAMTADEIRVKVGFDYVLYFEVLSGGFVQVLIDVALRIDDGSFTFRADQIGSMSQTVEIKLLEIHRTLLTGSAGTLARSAN